MPPEYIKTKEVCRCVLQGRMTEKNDERMVKVPVRFNDGRTGKGETYMQF